MDTPQARINRDEQNSITDPAMNSPAMGRTALAIGHIELSPETYQLIKDHDIKKGDVLTVAEVTGIFGAKQTSSLFAHCNPNTLSDINIEFSLVDEKNTVSVQSFIKTPVWVGVEMEALTAVSIACLAIYDMCKSVDHHIRIYDVQLVSKTGGQSGSYRSN